MVPATYKHVAPTCSTCGFVRFAWVDATHIGGVVCGFSEGWPKSLLRMQPAEYLEHKVLPDGVCDKYETERDSNHA